MPISVGASSQSFAASPGQANNQSIVTPGVTPDNLNKSDKENQEVPPAGTSSGKNNDQGN